MTDVVLLHLSYFAMTLFAFWVIFMDGAERLGWLERLIDLLSLDLLTAEPSATHRRIAMAISWMFLTGLYVFILLDH